MSGRLYRRRSSSSSVTTRATVTTVVSPLTCRKPQIKSGLHRTLCRRFSVLVNVLLPGQKKADVAGHSAGVFEHFGLQSEAEGSQVIVPELVSRLGSALQSRLPLGLRVVDPAAAIAAQLIGEAVDLDLGLSSLGGVVDQLRNEMHQLVGRPLRRFEKFRHHRFLLFFLLACAA